MRRDIPAQCLVGASSFVMVSYKVYPSKGPGAKGSIHSWWHHWILSEPISFFYWVTGGMPSKDHWVTIRRREHQQAGAPGDGSLEKRALALLLTPSLSPSCHKVSSLLHHVSFTNLR